MSTYDEYLVHRYQHPDGCGEPCSWCYPEPIPPGACPALDLLRAIVPIEVPEDPWEALDKIALR